MVWGFDFVNQRRSEASDETIGEWSVKDFAGRVLARPPRPTLAGPQLAGAARKLHQRLGLGGDGTESLLSALEGGEASVVRLAHQPNLFPYEQLIAQTLYIVEASAALREAGQLAVPMVLVVDYDACDDKRVRAARAFDPTAREQIRHFRLKVPRDVPTFLASAPTPGARTALADGLKGLARSHRSEPSRLIQHSGVARPASSLSEFNLFAWVNLIIGLWQLPILFVSLAELAPSFERERRLLAGRVARLLGREEDTLLWDFCPACHKRVSFGEPCCATDAARAWTIPRVLIDNLSDYVLYGVAGGTAYGEAINHLPEAHQVARSLDLDLPLESCWRLPPEAFQSGDTFAAATHPEARNMLLKGHNSLLEHLIDEDRVAAFLSTTRQAISSHLR
jgi:hypothetical protein